MSATSTPKPRRVLRRTRGKPTDIDVQVGAAIRRRRQLLGLSQTKLADALDVTFQQLQKYERGLNRASASRLWQLAKALDVPVGYFFADLPPDGGAPAAAALPAMDHVTADTVRHMATMNQPQRESVRNVARTIAVTAAQARGVASLEAA